MDNAIIYCRVSTDDQVDGTSLDVQEQACRKKAAELGATVLSVLKDEGVSGSLYLTRPGIQSALEIIERGDAKYLIMQKLDRSGRNTDIIRDIHKRVLRAKAQLILCDGMAFTDNAAGSLMLTIQAGFSEYEKGVIRERTMSGRNALARTGIQPYRTKVFGYHIPTKRDILQGLWPPGTLGLYQVIESEATIVSAIFNRLASGESIRSICRWLDLSGIKTVRGKNSWHATVVCQMIRNPVYKGCPAINKTEQSYVESNRNGVSAKRKDFRKLEQDQWINLECSAIVPEEVWDKCQLQIDKNVVAWSGRHGKSFLLTGLLKCPVCGRNMVGRRYGYIGKKNKEHIYYFCQRKEVIDGAYVKCSAKVIKGDKLEPFVLRGIVETLTNPQMVSSALKAYNLNQVKPTENKLPELRKRLKDLEKREAATISAQIDAIEDGRPFLPFSEMLNNMNSERIEIQSEIDKLSVRKPTKADEGWKDVFAAVADVLTSTGLDVKTKHALISTVVKRIDVADEGYNVEFNNVENLARGVNSICTHVTPSTVKVVIS